MIEEVNGYIENSTDNNKEVLNVLRALIYELVPSVNEQYKWSRPVYATEKDFCYLKTTKKAVTLGFFEFGKIKTNCHLIEGTGKTMRHIKIKNVEEIEKFDINKMIKEVLK
ncbi:DUF1801 domain-containing protein [Maribacter ulvicola]|uniref:YdhG-like domain-containing protein n=1 Tax=Maribacter ulvicola TaxID=228959 RepID=A0A1N6RVB8_9FLAO|nr:DUF1801 domain-containing protein [Maribacter ulvicola]SIQ32793.1 hypothetical protein SAMN05421797_1011413 [Maribacter ulvicola]